MNSFKLTYPACTVRAPIILTFVGCVAVPYLSALSHKRHAFRGGGEVIEHKMCFGFLYNFCLKHFSHYIEFNEILLCMHAALHVK